ncbi:hypothetical protein TPB0596_01730 [Tsukamurella pulmonis]|uniref:Uncharacterized protein n=1 Tax=Tsukamurella pulmonis TaxID=47312 RepID=A0A1H1HUF5_9ACTN|nr:DUF6510 family protein [Tsukamurella pulmonis]KXO94361.1 hypothetical protein AXK56_16995 [Tsukamurella pulmonis]KXP11760.1 hypothetical protein AXK57_21135 [Tsukamurella pulmonis]RDH12675.1 hypothetical protein DVB88_06370 [Tsukamurella pulmonis]SDR29054.1 hypothetical protein SAMN04489765_4606 [Tsukamurella pulmonis]SUP13110.1 Uncharacterised protein [Tsukamurella pulmonis]
MVTALDGNVATGPLAEVFGIDVSAALAECAECAKTDPFCVAVVYASPMGMVIRCRSCGAVLTVLVQREGTWRCRLTGVAALTLR